MTSILPPLEANTEALEQYREDIELAEKYASTGPRYTSYPTAPQLRSDVPVEQYYAWQRRPGEH